MLLFFVSSLVVAALGSSITNGTCYWKAGEEADEIYSPCGNTIDGNWPCCQLGDKCNDHNTCTWVAATGETYTYVAGCTDSNYQDSSCPYKGDFSEYEWVGLAWAGCEVSNGRVNWVGCENDGYPRVRISNESKSCICQDDDIPLLDQAPTGLVAVGFLPKSKMAEINWLPGYERTDSAVSATDADSSTSTRTLAAPTTRVLTTTSSTASTTASTTRDGSSESSNPSSTTSTSATDASNSTSTGSKVGMGVGYAFLGLAVVGLIITGAIKLLKRKQKQKRRMKPEIPPQDQEKNPTTPPSAFASTPAPIPAPIEPAMLDATSTQRTSTWSAPSSELPDSPATPATTDRTSPSITSSMGSRHGQGHGNDEHVIVYKPFRYQSAEMGGISELPEDAVVPMKSGMQSQYEAYSAERVGGVGRASPRRGQGGGGGVHELPG